MDFKRALIKPQKGVFSKPIRRLFKAKRVCNGFELYENNLQTLAGMEISLYYCMTLIRIPPCFIITIWPTGKDTETSPSASVSPEARTLPDTS